jgi:hypothetical protein
MPEVFHEDNWDHIVALPGGAVRFGGATQFLSAGLVGGGAADLTVSYWFRIFSDQSGGTFWESNNTDQQNNVEFFAGNNAPGLICRAQNPPLEGSMQAGSSITLGFGDWHHSMYYANTAATEGNRIWKMAIDGADVSQKFSDTGPDPFPFYADLGFVLGSDSFGNYTTVDIAELWMAFGQHLDPIADNQKFRSGDGKRVALGDHGEIPTGTPPTIYGHGGASQFLQPNLGTGGALTISGVLSDTAGP